MAPTRSQRASNRTNNSATPRARLGQRGPSSGTNAIPRYSPTVSVNMVTSPVQTTTVLAPIPEVGNPFAKPVNLLPFFNTYYKGPYILDGINSEGQLDEKLIHEVVRASFVLLKKRTRTMKFGAFKRKLLHNISESIIGTFPRLADQGEQGAQRYVSYYFFWGYLKHKVYQHTIRNVEHLTVRMRLSCFKCIPNKKLKKSSWID